MDEPSRRDVLGTLGAGTAVLVAGCGGRAPVGDHPGTPAATEAAPTPTEAEPTEPAEPAFWSWLPAPATIGNTYSLGALDLSALRHASLAAGTLRPQRYTPEAVQDALERTDRLVTISTGRVAGGILGGQYDVTGVGDGLVDAGLAESDGVYASERIGVAVDSDHLRWADSPDGPSALLDALAASLGGDGPSYPGVEAGLRRVLSVVEGRPARFARPIEVEDGAFGTATLLATGIGAGESGIRWTSAVAFEVAPPDEAVERYRSQFAAAQAFDRVSTTTGDGLLVIDAKTTAEQATSIQPL